MKFIGSTCIIVVVVLLISVSWVWFGFYDVAASRPDNKITRLFFSHVMDRSVKYHSRGIVAPDLTGAPQRMAGYMRFRERCVVCHGAPGMEPSAMGKGLLPYPPDLSEAIEDWKPHQAFWIVKNGIKMTGMPSFGGSISDQAVWEIIAFARMLPGMPPRQFSNFPSDSSMGK
jgi:mono/diheme cytochrome c family protein